MVMTVNATQDRQASDQEIPTDALEAGMAIFDEWFAENDSQICEMGGCDSQSLLASLWEAWRRT
jgi:hypothetical protein